MAGNPHYGNAGSIFDDALVNNSVVGFDQPLKRAQVAYMASQLQAGAGTQPFVQAEMKRYADGYVKGYLEGLAWQRSPGNAFTRRP